MNVNSETKSRFRVLRLRGFKFTVTPVAFARFMALDLREKESFLRSAVAAAFSAEQEATGLLAAAELVCSAEREALSVSTESEAAESCLPSPSLQQDLSLGASGWWVRVQALAARAKAHALSCAVAADAALVRMGLRDSTSAADETSLVPQDWSAECAELRLLRAFVAQAEPLRLLRAPPADALKLCAKSDNVDGLRLLLADGRLDPAADSSLPLLLAADRGNAEMVRALLEDRRADPAARFSLLVVFHSVYNYLVSWHPTVLDPYKSTVYNMPSASLQAACTRGDLSTVLALLGDRRADPAALSSVCLFTACALGHSQIVRALLDDRRADPSAGDSECLVEACKGGHLNVVRALLEDSRADPAGNKSRCLWEACRNNFYECALALLADGRADPSSVHSSALVSSCWYGRDKVVHALLADRRANPAEENSLCLRSACQRGHRSIVVALLKDGRVDPAAAENTCLRIARLCGWQDVERLLTERAHIEH